MTSNGNFYNAIVFEGNGFGRVITLEDACEKPVWIHLDYNSKAAKSWLKDKSNLNSFVIEALVAQETRPRALMTHNGILLILRNINELLNSKSASDSEAMVSLRCWIEESRVITLSKRKLPSVSYMQDLFQKGDGPATIGEFVEEIIDVVTDGVNAQIDVLNEQIDALEDKIVSSFGRIDYSMRPELSSYRRRIIELRRYMAPQRDALSRLAQMDRFHWLTEVDRFHFMEISDRTIRGVEDLDEARDRATVIQETLASRISEQVEQRMYILSMVAAIFLPLTFVTGLLGTNIGGIPGSTTSWAFFAVSAFLVGVAVIEYWIFKRKRWM